MKAYLNDITNAAKAYQKASENISAKYNAIRAKYKNGDLSENEYKAAMTDEQKDHAQNKGNLSAKIVEIRKAAEAAMPALYAPKGTEVNDDAKLLTGAIKLSQSDLDGIADRNKNNRTMLNMIASYADVHGLTAYHPMTVKKAMEKVDDYISMAQKVTNGGLSATLNLKAMETGLASDQL